MTSFFCCLAISAIGKIVPAPVPLPPVPITMTTECRLRSDATSSRDSSSAFLARSGLCIEPIRRVVPAPMTSRSSFGRSFRENSLVSRNFVVMARRSRSAYLASVFCVMSKSRRNSAFNDRRMFPPPPPELRRRIFT